jgi:hypothetical protein
LPLGRENLSKVRSVFDDRRYTRYDPDGRGDFYIDEYGTVYNSGIGGIIGRPINPSKLNSNTTRGKNYALL